jgi:hypothetical protein
MHALISGQAGTALVFDGPAIQSVRLLGAEVRVDGCSPADAAHLLGAGEGVEVVEDVTLDWVTVRLRILRGAEDGLTYLLNVLDPDLSQDQRGEAAVRLERLFADDQVARRVRGVLCARALPSQADLNGGLEMAARRACTGVRDVLIQLRDDQPLIREVAEALRGLTINGGAVCKAMVSALTHSGAPWDMTECVAGHLSLERFLSRYLCSKGLTAYPAHSDAIRRWIAAVGRSREGWPVSAGGWVQLCESAGRHLLLTARRHIRMLEYGEAR